jgi:S-adenosylmethionine:tRNA ribosyltransferase-isomerase
MQKDLKNKIQPLKIQPLNLVDFHYNLPQERIAQFPLEKRDDAKLQVYIKGEIAHSQFFKLHHFLRPDTLLIFNDTKVIPARLFFQKKTGAWIEIFLLSPHEPKDIFQALQQSKTISWECMIGNKKKWKNDEILTLTLPENGNNILLHAELLENEDQKNLVKFTWETFFPKNTTDHEIIFSEILEKFGNLPLPPYFEREVSESDKERYQTVYAQAEGAVAAPTAGLHFTNEVLENIEKKGIKKDFITLHVSGGTFQPIKAKKIIDHEMHSEQMAFTKENLENIANNITHIVAVGTTSMRSLESLYWFGAKIFELINTTKKITQIPFFIEKLYPYQHNIEELPTAEQSIRAILKYMKFFNMNELKGRTEIFIFPGYTFKMCKGLITNYHLPDTTLILLVASFVGEDWRKIYNEALQNDYRFLSYGDSSLLIP